MDEEITRFDSTSDEIRYWKEKAESFAKECRDVKSELDEFQEGSRELEAELEIQLEQVEKKNKELKSLSNRLQMENDHLKDKLEQCHQEYNSRITDLQNELSEIRSIKEQLHKYVRELEQQNDDLERAKRSTVASLEDFEIRMNAAIERNVYLESELDEKEALKSAVQRLKDETKDLRSELKILAPDNDKAAAEAVDSNRKDEEQRIKCHSSVPNSPSKTSSSPSSPIQTQPPPLTPSARISALNIVGDLLRKVGALELKLVSCRNIVKENQHNHKANGGLSPNGIANISNGHRMPRVASTPIVKDAS